MFLLLDITKSIINGKTINNINISCWKQYRISMTLKMAQIKRKSTTNKYLIKISYNHLLLVSFIFSKILQKLLVHIYTYVYTRIQHHCTVIITYYSCKYIILLMFSVHIIHTDVNLVIQTYLSRLWPLIDLSLIHISLC